MRKLPARRSAEMHYYSNIHLCNVFWLLTIGIASKAYVEAPKKSGRSDQPENFSNSDGRCKWPYKYWYIDTNTITMMIFANHDNHVRDPKSRIRQNRMRKGNIIGMYSLVFMWTASTSAIAYTIKKQITLYCSNLNACNLMKLQFLLHSALFCAI